MVEFVPLALSVNLLKTNNHHNRAAVVVDTAVNTVEDKIILNMGSSTRMGPGNTIVPMVRTQYLRVLLLKQTVTYVLVSLLLFV